MQNPGTAGGRAQCAIHPERIATRTCARCGNFTCDGCNAQGQESMCPTCRSLTGADAFAFTRTSYSFDGIWGYAFEKWKQQWVKLSVSVLILVAVSLVVFAFNSAFEAAARIIVGTERGVVAAIYVAIASTVMSQIVSMLVQGTFFMGLIRISIDVLQGKPADVTRITSQLPKLGRYVVQMLVVQVMITLPVLLYMAGVFAAAAAASGLPLLDIEQWRSDAVPGMAIGIVILGWLPLIPALFYVGIPLVFANMELVHGDVGPVESIRRAFVIAKGHRFSVFGFAFIAFLITIVGLIACCIGIIPAWGLSYLLLTGVYLALRNGAGLPPPVES